MGVGGKRERRVKNTTSDWTYITKEGGGSIQRKVPE